MAYAHPSPILLRSDTRAKENTRMSSKIFNSTADSKDKASSSPGKVGQKKLDGRKYLRAALSPLDPNDDKTDARSRAARQRRRSRSLGPRDILGDLIPEVKKQPEGLCRSRSETRVESRKQTLSVVYDPERIDENDKENLEPINGANIEDHMPMEARMPFEERDDNPETKLALASKQIYILREVLLEQMNTISDLRQRLDYSERLAEQRWEKMISQFEGLAVFVQQTVGSKAN
eukprot:1386485-Amorphochlora_amoeboformis.AAC.1